MSISTNDTDFIGFTFNNIHSSTFNIVRVSNGSRFSENLLPTFADITSTREPADGTFFFSSNYEKREFQLQIAYDSLTEKNFRDLCAWLGDKQIHSLIFDERPYKSYQAKVSGAPKLDYICFLVDGNRVYKGEGTINFICYEAYATQPYTDTISNKVKYKKYKHYLNDYSDLTRVSEWASSSGMLQTNYDQGLQLDKLLMSGTDGTIELFNPGDAAVPIKIYINISNAIGGSQIPIQGIDLVRVDDTRLSETELLGKLTFNFDDMTSEITTQYFVLNSNNRLIEGMDEDYQKDGTIYNKYISSGEFFMIPTGKSRLKIYNCTSTTIEAVEYPYYYL